MIRNASSVTTSLTPIDAVRTIAALQALTAVLEADDADKNAEIEAIKSSDARVRPSLRTILDVIWTGGPNPVDLDIEEARRACRRQEIAHVETLRRMAEAALASGKDYLLISTRDFALIAPHWDQTAQRAA